LPLAGFVWVRPWGQMIDGSSARRFAINQGATALNQDSMLNTRKTSNETTFPRTAKITSNTFGLATSTVQPLVSASKRWLSDHIKTLRCKLENALEGDHEFHKYLGM
jgi:hypothetical protein